MLKGKGIYFLTALSVVGVWFFWLFFASKYVPDPPLPSAVKFENAENAGPAYIQLLGSFGDTFGVIASLMATTAAAAALWAFMKQSDDSKKQEFERNFFTLLNNLQIMISEIDVSRHQGVKELANDLKEQGLTVEQRNLRIRVERPFLTKKGVISGRDALRHLLNTLRKSIGDSQKFRDSKFIASSFENFSIRWSDDLGHYFRTCYHLFKMIDEECPGDKQRYARILRAHFSNSETILLAYNCSVGIGRFKFKEYIATYSVLHNIKRGGKMRFYTRELDFFKRHFSEDAFRHDEDIPYVYDDINLYNKLK